ncbi:hypothetical protein E4U42_002822 [Claviceps africana]|uniref:Response regulatory domain-containing protein n=1 Tax=Claviceps africana TaxID=83212 RepID=A0A8K0NH89_9HYPO|nr:hypothetical protein E4U42_002822 [Claviceps africana]
MASDIASRIKARFSTRRRSVASPPTASGSTLGDRESSLGTAPSQISCEPPFSSPPRPWVARLLSDDGTGMTSGFKTKTKTKTSTKTKTKKQLSRWHLGRTRLVSSSSASARNEFFLHMDEHHEMDDDDDDNDNDNEDDNDDDDNDDDNPVASSAAAASPRRLSAVRGRRRVQTQQTQQTQRLLGARGRSLSPGALLQRPGTAAPASPASPASPAPSQSRQVACHAAASQAAPQAAPRSHLHLHLHPHPHSHPPQPPTQRSSTHSPPPSQRALPLALPSPLLPKSPRTPKSAASNSPRRLLQRILVPHLRDIGAGSPGPSVSPVSANTSPLAHDDVSFDPLCLWRHGIEPDPLTFVSHPAAACHLPAAATAPIPHIPRRRRSLFASRQTSLIKNLLRSNQPPGAADTEPRLSIDTDMVSRKIWVRRPHASPTTILINEDDLVDDVRDLILRKYANSLGRTFDSPDLMIRLCPRDQSKERTLGPDEVMARTLDAAYPGGQTVDEALVIDIPRRPPNASPRAPTIPGMTAYYLADDGRPSEAGEGYFPPVVAVPSPHPPHLPHPVPVAPNGTASHSIAVLGTGHIAPIPSPGGGRTRMPRERSDRPRLGRTHTSSPTTPSNQNPVGQSSTAGNHGTQTFDPRLPHSRTHSNFSDRPPGSTGPTGLPAAKSILPKSPAPEAAPAKAATPPPRSSSPRSRRGKKISEYSTPANMLNGSVPPINVLIVEDNPINLKLLEAFVKRLKVRWQTAMNGRDAVTKWRSGGYHLVLMDIQLPVMNGLDATREIRRLERVNSIGVFSSTSDGNEDGTDENELKEADRLQNMSLFKSPVIIVALTASSLQSDRHEALAAGCNDFLTKPVNFVWLERKVMEWGCMQALIDFDGWRKWKEAYSRQNEERGETKKASAAKNKSRKARSALQEAA